MIHDLHAQNMIRNFIFAPRAEVVQPSIRYMKTNQFILASK